MNCAKCQRPLKQVEFGAWAHVDGRTGGHVADPGKAWKTERAARFAAMKAKAAERLAP